MIKKTFHLLAFSFILTFGCILMLSACKLNPNLQGKGENYLQGEWQQDSVKIQKQLVSYSLHHFKFSCDSFFVKINTFSKVNYGADTCMGSGHWTEYIKGNYEQKHDTLFLRGQFCNADYSLKDAGGCFRSGVYEEFFRINKKTDSLVQFTSASSVIPINLHLIKKTSCIPKPL